MISLSLLLFLSPPLFHSSFLPSLSLSFPPPIHILLCYYLSFPGIDVTWSRQTQISSNGAWAQMWRVSCNCLVLVVHLLPLLF